MQPKNEQEKQQFDFVNKTIEKGPLSSLGDDRIAFMDQNGVSAQIVGYGNLCGKFVAILCHSHVGMN